MKKRILIIDDDVLIRTVLRSELEEAGYEVYELESGVGANDMIENKGIDLIVLDLFMEDQEGIETLRSIRASFQQQPIFVISSNRDFFDIVMDMGANKTMIKPLDIDNFLLTVKALLF